MHKQASQLQASRQEWQQCHLPSPQAFENCMLSLLLRLLINALTRVLAGVQVNRHVVLVTGRGLKS
jgi:hypothetical protein